VADRRHRSCDSRKYTYFFPSYMLIPPKPGSGLGETHKRLAAEAAPPHPFWADAGLDSEPEEDLRRKRAWRCAPEHVEALRATVARYERSHNFHNFTVGRDFNDRSAQRNMKSIQVCRVRFSLCADANKSIRLKILSYTGTLNGSPFCFMGRASCFTRSASFCSSPTDN
jgi:tRNA U38,U39,U40 pseudouridine synthase TruA